MRLLALHKHKAGHSGEKYVRCGDGNDVEVAHVTLRRRKRRPGNLGRRARRVPAERTNNGGHDGDEAISVRPTV